MDMEKKEKKTYLADREAQKCAAFYQKDVHIIWWSIKLRTKGGLRYTLKDDSKDKANT